MNDILKKDKIETETQLASSETNMASRWSSNYELFVCLYGSVWTYKCRNNKNYSRLISALCCSSWLSVFILLLFQKDMTEWGRERGWVNWRSADGGEVDDRLISKVECSLMDH